MNNVNSLQVIKIAARIGPLLDKIMKCPKPIKADKPEIEAIKLKDGTTVYMVTIRSAYATEEDAKKFAEIDNELDDVTMHIK